MGDSFTDVKTEVRSRGTHPEALWPVDEVEERPTDPDSKPRFLPLCLVSQNSSHVRDLLEEEIPS